MMGLAAGGMLPVANALLAEIMPTKHRVWCLVLLGGIGTIGSYFCDQRVIGPIAATLRLAHYVAGRIPYGTDVIALSPLLPGVGPLPTGEGPFRGSGSNAGSVWNGDHARSRHGVDSAYRHPGTCQ